MSCHVRLDNRLKISVTMEMSVARRLAEVLLIHLQIKSWPFSIEITSQS